MRILVTGANGCIGSAVVRSLRWRGHAVVEGLRRPSWESATTLVVDLLDPIEPAAWGRRLAPLDLDAVVHCAGTALPGAADARSERLHASAPLALFAGAVAAGVRRIAQVSALGVDSPPAGAAANGWDAKRRADDALLGMAVDAAVIRPGCVHGPRSRATAALVALAHARTPLPSACADQLVQPIHVFELAEAIAALVERTGAAGGRYEIGGPDVLRVRDLLAVVRDVARCSDVRGHGADPTATSTPAAPRLHLAAWFDRPRVTRVNAAHVLLGRAPSSIAEAFAVTPVHAQGRVWAGARPLDAMRALVGAEPHEEPSER